MITNITKIGNSRGLIIPAQLLKQCNFKDEVSLEIKNNDLVISKVKKPRETWEDIFAAEEDDNAMIDSFNNDFDESEWIW